MTDPVRVGELLPGVLAELVDRAGPGYERWAEQVAATGYCTHPVRLRGRSSTQTPRPVGSEPCTRPTGSRMPPFSRPAGTAGPRCAPPAR
jgi:hypothetical protein